MDKDKLFLQGGYSLLHKGAEVPGGDRTAVLKAVQRDGTALLRAPEKLRGDRGVVLAAVGQYGRALRWASEALRGPMCYVMH